VVRQQDGLALLLEVKNLIDDSRRGNHTGG
jgi:hypothetical protein